MNVSVQGGRDSQIIDTEATGTAVHFTADRWRCRVSRRQHQVGPLATSLLQSPGSTNINRDWRRPHPPSTECRRRPASRPQTRPSDSRSARRRPQRRDAPEKPFTASCQPRHDRSPRNRNDRSHVFVGHGCELAQHNHFTKITPQLFDGAPHRVGRLPLNHQCLWIETLVGSVVLRLVEHNKPEPPCLEKRPQQVLGTIASSHARASSPRRHEKDRSARTYASCTTS
jgi:hypothetical protein